VVAVELRRLQELAALAAAVAGDFCGFSLQRRKLAHPSHDRRGRNGGHGRGGNGGAGEIPALAFFALARAAAAALGLLLLIMLTAEWEDWLAPGPVTINSTGRRQHGSGD
jgi:hypothetical protein